VIVEALEISVLDINNLRRNALYCYVLSSVPRTISSLLVILALCITIICEVLIGIILYRRWRIYRKLAKTTSQAPSLGTLTRIVLFTLFVLVAVSVAFGLAVTHHMTVAGTPVLSIMPLAAFLTASIGTDIIRVWMWWKHPADNKVYEGNRASDAE